MSAAAAPETCSACGALAVVGGVCGRCGAAFGERNRCPHCQALARVEPRGEGKDRRWVCAVCGGPRTPEGLGGDEAAERLRDARRARATAGRARAASMLFALMALFATLVTAAAWPAAIVAKLVLFVSALAPTLLALRARAKVPSSAKAEGEALEKAWLAAAEEVAAGRPGGVTAAELGRRLRVDEARADALLTSLAVHDRTRVEVDDEAEVRYSVSPGRLRFETPAGVERGASDPDEEMLDEQATEQERRAAREIPR